MRAIQSRFWILLGLAAVAVGLVLCVKQYRAEQDRAALEYDDHIQQLEQADSILICEGTRSGNSITFTLLETIRGDASRTTSLSPGDIVTILELRDSAVEVAPVAQAIYLTRSYVAGGRYSNTIPIYDGKLYGSGLTLDDLRRRFARSKE